MGYRGGCALSFFLGRWIPSKTKSPGLRPTSIPVSGILVYPVLWPQRTLSIVDKRLDRSRCHLVRRYRPRPMPHCVRRGPSSPKRGTASSTFFSAHVYCGHGRPSQLLQSSCLFLSLRYDFRFLPTVACHSRRRCGHMSNYFDHLLIFLLCCLH